MKISSLMIQFQIRFEPEWVPREENEQADYLSQITDLDYCFLNPAICAQLDVTGLQTTITCLEAVDAFTVDWSGENNWWCPPIALIPRVIRDARACSAYGT